MGKKCNSCLKDACRKLYKAVSVSPAVRAIRSISTNTSPTPPVKPIDIQFKQPNAMKSDQVPNSLRNSDAVEVVPIKFDYPVVPPASEKPKSAANRHISPTVASNKHPEAPQQPKVGVRKSSVHGRNMGNSNMEAPHVNKEEGEKTGVHIEDRFTEFINRAKMKLRTTSNVGDGWNTPGEDHNVSGHHVNASGKDSDDPGKDKFSEYINRAKKKLRSTSSIGFGKYSSFK